LPVDCASAGAACVSTTLKTLTRKIPARRMCLAPLVV
jgi:hypothetical protein